MPFSMPISSIWSTASRDGKRVSMTMRVAPLGSSARLTAFCRWTVNGSGYRLAVSRRYHVFINDAAGIAREGDVSARDLADAFRQLGVDATVVDVDAEHLPDAMRDAWRSGIDAVVVGGGDGTTNCAAGVAVADDMVLGVLPMGTFNHFAKDLGMPSDLEEAVRFLAAAEITAVDVGEVNGRIFVNNASIGVYPEMVANRDEIRKRRGWGKIRAAPMAIVRTLRRLPVRHLRLTIDDSPPLTIDTPLLFIGNGSFDDDGVRVGQRTSLEDHRLCAYAFATTSRWRLVVNAIRARLGGVTAAPLMMRQSGEQLIVDSDERSLAIALDGEPTDLRVPLRFQARPGALRVLAAAPSRGEGE
jgi:diacylglycerol kinase family enzyme